MEVKDSSLQKLSKKVAVDKRKKTHYSKTTLKTPYAYSRLEVLTTIYSSRMKNKSYFTSTLKKKKLSTRLSTCNTRLTTIRLKGATLFFSTSILSAKITLWFCSLLSKVYLRPCQMNYYHCSLLSSRWLRNLNWELVITPLELIAL
jgi:hypothetical protein